MAPHAQGLARIELPSEKEGGDPPGKAAPTPMVRQYLELKAAHPETILFFRLGDFYEMFFEDAERAAGILQITLTSRSKGADPIPMCGVPYHSSRRYIAKLVEAGLRVAICEQVSEPGGPGIVRREVVRVVTPGTFLDEEVLDPSDGSYVAVLSPQDPRSPGGCSRLEVALLEATTGELSLLGLCEGKDLLVELARLSVRELLVPEGTEGDPLWVTLREQLPGRPVLATLAPQAFEARAATRELTAHFQSHFGVASLEGFGVADDEPGLGPAGAALRYLKQTQRTDAAHVVRLTRVARTTHLTLDETSLANLEILRTLREGTRKGSLLGCVDRTVTALGARRLAAWLSAPSRELSVIEARHAAVGELVQGPTKREGLVERLRTVGDLERTLGRVAMGTASPRDLRSLGAALDALPGVAELLATCESPALSAQAGPLRALPALAQRLGAAIVEDPPAHLREGGVFQKGHSEELDGLIDLSTNGKDILLAIETRERERTGIASLKVRYNKVFGYFIEITRANLHLVPRDYERKQTMVGSERFVTAELKEHEERILHAEERRCALEAELFEALRLEVLESALAIREAADAIATVDALLSFARTAVEHRYVRPTVDDSADLEIVEGRHPVVERLGVERFVPNDLQLDGERRLMLITGPNMAGKSTVMRQVALITLLAHAGSFVPARRARIGLCDRIFTRVGASDNLARGQSTFMVEMTETANILHNATARSLLVLDEIGRGTSTFDGLSIAWAVAEALVDGCAARTLFATHYHELTELGRTRPHVRNTCVSVQERDGRVVFLRKLVEGAASRSYGIEVARLAGLPSDVLGRAREVLTRLEAGEPLIRGRARAGEGGDQLPLFVPAPREARDETASGRPAKADEEDAALDAGWLSAALKEVDPDRLTPLDALGLLARWKERLRPEDGRPEDG